MGQSQAVQEIGRQDMELVFSLGGIGVKWSYGMYQFVDPHFKC